MFRLQMAGGGVTGLAYLTRLSLSATQEDWQTGARRAHFLASRRRAPSFSLVSQVRFRLTKLPDKTTPGSLESKPGGFCLIALLFTN